MYKSSPLKIGTQKTSSPSVLQSVIETLNWELILLAMLFLGEIRIVLLGLFRPQTLDTAYFSPVRCRFESVGQKELIL